MIASADAELEIALDQISPQPVEPGQDLTMSVRLEKNLAIKSADIRKWLNELECANSLMTP